MCGIWKKKKSYEMLLEQTDRIFSQLKPLDVIRLTEGEPFSKDDTVDIVNIINKRVKPGIIHITETVH